MSEQVCASAFQSWRNGLTKMMADQKFGEELEVMDEKKAEGTGLNRRDFIKGAVAGSTVLATGLPQTLVAEKAPSSSRPFAELRSLAPGAIKPEGWVRLHMEGQAKLATVLPEISYPFFSGTFWEGEENSPAWFTWEQKAYWVDGSVRLALSLGDEALLAKARASLDYTLNHPSSSGFLGPKFLEFGEDFGGLNRWPNTVLNRGFMALADARPTPARVDSARIVEALHKHYLNDNVSYTSGNRNITNLEVILWCYERTADRKLLELAQTAWDTYMREAEIELAATAKGKPGHRGFSMHTDLAPSRVYSNTPIETHGVSYAETSKLPAILYLYTGKEEYRKFVVAAQQRIFDHHMLIDGIPSSSEAYAGTTALDEHETCDITDHAWAWTYVLQATGDGVWGDHIERACFNAHPGVTRTDWKGIQYFGSPNQVLANLNCDHATERWFGSRRLAYQPNPAQLIGCCGGNVHRFFPNYVLNMWMQTKDNGLAATLYGPSTVTAKVGSANQQVQIIQKTNYPFEEHIRFEIKSDRPISFPLSLRIPAWCSAPQIKVNGVSATADQRQNGFAVLRRTYKPGDVVTLDLPMNVKTSEWPNNGIGIERGPLVYALPVETKWTSVAEAAYSSEEFPTWEANPAGAWNYGVALDPAKAESQIEVKQKPSTQNLETSTWPWSDAPTVLTVPARKLEGWSYETNPKEPHQRFTPQLPDTGSLNASAQVERITLVPFGATQLRMSIFPKVKG
jgi:uncharacterized protein